MTRYETCTHMNIVKGKHCSTLHPPVDDTTLPWSCTCHSIHGSLSYGTWFTYTYYAALNSLKSISHKYEMKYSNLNAILHRSCLLHFHISIIPLFTCYAEYTKWEDCLFLLDTFLHSRGYGIQNEWVCLTMHLSRLGVVNKSGTCMSQTMTYFIPFYRWAANTATVSVFPCQTNHQACSRKHAQRKDLTPRVVGFSLTNFWMK